MKIKLKKRAVAVEEWEWFGQAGHFICAAQCMYHLHTHVGRYCVSTVGEHYPDGIVHHEPQGEMQFMGASECHYETMVFKLDRDRQGISNHSELDARQTKTRDEAAAIHKEFCLKYAGR